MYSVDPLSLRDILRGFAGFLQDLFYYPFNKRVAREHFPRHRYSMIRTPRLLKFDGWDSHTVKL